jgi:tetratricopeptide (TPR) repeat protein
MAAVAPMTKQAGPRFDPETVRELAGDRSFARGEAYFRDGAVAIISLRPQRVVARVAGSEDYRTELTGSGADIGGSCSCRAFHDYGFCKHMVAAALAANAAGEAQTTGGNPLDRIRDHLRSKPVDALVDMILDMAERDPALFRKLDLAAATLQGDGKAIESRLRKAIDGATRTRGYIEYAAVSGWAEGVNEALDALADLAGAQSGVALKLAEHAIDRIGSAVMEIDDSDGHGGALLDRARDIHLAACSAERPDPVGLARYLFERELHHPFDTFEGAAGLYEDVLGEAGLAEYRRLANKAWSKLPARMGRRKGRMDDFSGDRGRLMTILDFFAERDGDVEARIALRARDLSSPWQYQQLARFCLDQGREEEALKHAEEGLWIFEDESPDLGLTLLVADLLAKKGRKEDAAARLWTVFEKEPSFDLYNRLARIGGKAARDRAIKLIEARSSAAKRADWSWNQPGNLLVEILMHEKAFDEAWAAVARHGATSGMKEALARATERTHPGEALAVYAARVEELAGGAAYEEAVKLIARMAKLRGAAEHASYVADLRQRHQRKRNFMKLLA